MEGQGRCSRQEEEARCYNGVHVNIDMTNLYRILYVAVVYILTLRILAGEERTAQSRSNRKETLSGNLPD